jgi:flagellar motility protein MotE (MotC chaperone)
MIGLLIRFLRGLRLVPVVLVAVIALFALKALGLVLDGGYLSDNAADVRDIGDNFEVTGTIAPPNPAPPRTSPPPRPSQPAAKPSWAQDMFNYPDGSGAAAPPTPPRPASAQGSPSPQSAPSLDVTGSIARPPGRQGPQSGQGSDIKGSDIKGSDITGAVNAPANPPKEGTAPAKSEAPAAKPQEPPPSPNGTPVPLDIEHPVSPAERAILESLQKRRAELDARAHELDVREDLLLAAEKRVAGRIDELKDIEARVDAAMQKKDEGEVARLKNVVAMYENMKAKDAAKIFDGLDIRVLLDVVKEINPRRMSDILAQMTPENAQRLTVELAARSAQKDSPQTADLPKIQGRPNPN